MFCIKRQFTDSTIWNTGEACDIIFQFILFMMAINKRFALKPATLCNDITAGKKTRIKTYAL